MLILQIEKLRVRVPYFKIYYKEMVIKKEWYWFKKDI